MSAHAFNPSGQLSPLRTDASGNLLINLAGGSSSPVKTIQQGSIVLNGVGSGTSTITSVNTAKTVVLHSGVAASTGAGVTDIVAGVTLTNSTTVTAQRGVATGNVTVYFTVLEFV